METKKYIMWNEGVVSSFGELISKDETTITVKNPVVVVFSAVNEPVIDNNGNVVMDAKGQPVMKGSLNWDMNPYIFGVCLKDSSCNIWTTTPKSVISEDAEYDERLVKHYETLIHLCDKGAVPVEPTETTDSETTTEA
jgi:hypothetical protein